MQKGDSFRSNELVITKEKILKYAKLSNDFNPIHVDPEFAKNTPFGNIIAHGLLSLNLLWKLILEHYGEKALENIELDIRFTKPVIVDETIQACINIVEITEKEENQNKYTLDVKIIDSLEESVIAGKAELVLDKT